MKVPSQDPILHVCLNSIYVGYCITGGTISIYWYNQVDTSVITSQAGVTKCL